MGIAISRTNLCSSLLNIFHSVIRLLLDFPLFNLFTWYCCASPPFIFLVSLLSLYTGVNLRHYTQIVSCNFDAEVWSGFPTKCPICQHSVLLSGLTLGCCLSINLALSAAAAERIFVISFCCVLKFLRASAVLLPRAILCHSDPLFSMNKRSLSAFFFSN